MSNLPRFQTQDKPLSDLISTWTPPLNSLLSLPINNGILLQDIEIITGTNIINHKLSRKLVGWFPVRMQGTYAELYDTQSTNTMPDKTLVLNSNADTIVSIWVF